LSFESRFAVFTAGPQWDGGMCAVGPSPGEVFLSLSGDKEGEVPKESLSPRSGPNSYDPLVPVSRNGNIFGWSTFEEGFEH